MGKNLSKQIFRRDGTTGSVFTVPSGVRSLEIKLKEMFEVSNGSFSMREAQDKYGNYFSWGVAPVGDGTLTNRLSNHVINSFLGVPMRSTHLRTDGQMVNWGPNTLGQIGDGTTITRSTTTLVSGGHIFRKISRGSTCAGLTEAGDLYMWGSNNRGQLGQGDFANRSTPTQVLPGTKFVDFWGNTGADPITQSLNTTMFAKDTTGQTWAWGADAWNQGQLGTGAFGDSETPTLIPGALDFVKIHTCALAGGGHTMGMTRDGTAYAWGYNNAGQIGDNSIVSKSTPTLVIGGYKFADIGAGTNSSMGLSKDGALYVWGDNSQGQLGQGSIFPKSSPVIVPSLSSGVKKAYITGQAMYAIDPMRVVYAWGYQETLFPVLGVGDNNKKSVPTLISNIGFAGIAKELIVDNPATVALVTEYGTRWSWGENIGGQMGVNSATARFNVPVINLAPVQTGNPPTIAGNVHWKVPETKIERFTVPVTPGQEINIKYLLGSIKVPEFSIESSQWCEEVEIEWEG